MNRRQKLWASESSPCPSNILGWCFSIFFFLVFSPHSNIVFVYNYVTGRKQLCWGSDCAEHLQCYDPSHPRPFKLLLNRRQGGPSRLHIRRILAEVGGRVESGTMLATISAIVSNQTRCNCLCVFSALGYLSLCQHAERKGALVLHIELVHDRPLPHRHDRHDSPSRFAKGTARGGFPTTTFTTTTTTATSILWSSEYCLVGNRSVQWSIHIRRGQGREWLETCAWRRIPPTRELSDALQRVHRDRSAAVLHGLRNPILRTAGPALPCEQRIAHHCFYSPLCLHGIIRWYGAPSYSETNQCIMILRYRFLWTWNKSGFYSSMTYKMFRGIQWKKNTLMTAFLYPGIVFSILFVINLVLWVEGEQPILAHMVHMR